MLLIALSDVLIRKIQHKYSDCVSCDAAPLTHAFGHMMQTVISKLTIFGNNLLTESLS